MGGMCYHDGDYEGAFEYFKKAAELGDIMANFNLSIVYREGKCVEKRQPSVVILSRFNLGVYDDRRGNPERATKHFIIAAKLGYDKALDAVKKLFSVGVVSKEDFEAALRGHQAAVDETKSKQKEEAYAFHT